MSLKDPAQVLGTKYYTLLNGQVTVDGETIRVFSVEPKNTGGNRILITENSTIEDSIKDSYMTDVTQEVEIITEFSERGTKEKEYKISNAIMQIIKSSFAGGMSLTGFDVINTDLDNAIDIPSLDDTKKVFRRVLRFRHTIDQT
jgi:hypothetical protein